jgi:ATP-dependent DNA ligase
MAKATIPLAKGYDITKITWPAYLSTKYDGVPVKIAVTKHDVKGSPCYAISGESRSGENLKSTSDDLADFLQMLIDHDCLTDDKHVFVAEVTHRTLKNFKDISGVVRRQEPQEDLLYNFFDYQVGDLDAGFTTRNCGLEDIIVSITNRFSDDRFKYVKQTKCYDVDDFIEQLVHLQETQPDAEGHIARSGDATFKPNSRHWDYQKIVIDPTVDLRIIDVQEAVSKTKEPLGMVGRLVAEYKGKRIGIGPGKLSHVERKQLWINYHGARPTKEFPNMIATIKYKRDDSYEALRQPTFQHWRPEKTEESYD